MRDQWIILPINDEVITRMKEFATKQGALDISKIFNDNAEDNNEEEEMNYEATNIHDEVTNETKNDVIYDKLDERLMRYNLRSLTNDNQDDLLDTLLTQYDESNHDAECFSNIE